MYQPRKPHLAGETIQPMQCNIIDAKSCMKNLKHKLDGDNNRSSSISITVAPSLALLDLLLLTYAHPLLSIIFFYIKTTAWNIPPLPVRTTDYSCKLPSWTSAVSVVKLLVLLMDWPCSSLSKPSIYKGYVIARDVIHNASRIILCRRLFNLLQRIGCLPKLLKMIIFFNDDMKGSVKFNGSSSEPF